MPFKKTLSYHLVKSEDLNHHGTLFAGRCAEWFVESGFVAAAQLLEPHHIVCLKMHGMEFLTPIHAGDIIQISGSIVYGGRSTLIAHVRITENKSEKTACEGFMTFCYVDENTRPQQHGLNFVADNEEDQKIQNVAKTIKERDLR